MKKIKRLIFLLLIIIATSSFVFFNLLHFDTLARHTPSNVTVYFHSYPKFIHNILLKHPKLVNLMNFSLVSNETIEKNDILEALKLSKKEVAIFHSQQNNWQIMTFSSKNLENYLQNKKIPYTKNNKTVLFPSIIDDQKKFTKEVLTQNPDFQAKKLNFSLAYIYFSSKNSLFLPNYISQNYNEPFFAYLTIKNNNFNITTSLASSIFYNNNQKDSLFNLDTATIFAKNANYSHLPLPAGIQKNNFTYRLLQKLGKVDEFIKIDENREIIVINEKNKNLYQIMTLIRKEIALLYPIEVEKILPDQSLAVQLKAVPDAWSFEKLENNTDSYFLNVENDFNLLIIKDQTKIIVAKNIEISTIKSLLSAQKTITNCSLANSYIKIKDSTLDNLDIQYITISAENPLSTSICLQ